MSRKTLIVDHPTAPQGDAAKINELIQTGEPTGIETAGPEAIAPKSIEFERFMQEPVQLAISPAVESSGIDPGSFQLSVNGKIVQVERGRNITLPRYLAEVVLRARMRTFEQEKLGPNPDDYYMVPSDTQSYQAAVISDTPEGIAWASRIMANPQ